MDQKKAINNLESKIPDELEAAAKEAARLLNIARNDPNQTDKKFKAMAQLCCLLRGQLDAYLKGSLSKETIVAMLISSDRAFKSQISTDDFMDIDEGHVAEFNHKNEFSQILIDAIWLHRYKLDDSAAPAFHNKIQAIIQPLQDEKVLSKSQLITTLELQSLSALGLVNQNFQNLSRHIFTREFYEQRKYNLLREENEGFSKLLLEINQENLSMDNYKIVIESIQKLIGYFSLDPNRVLELILCAFQCNLTNGAYIELLRQFGTQHALSQLLGFKFQRLAAYGAYDCKTLFDLAALLIKHEIVDLTDIWSHFEIQGEEQEDEIEKLLQQQAKSLEYQYGMLFKTIMDNNRFEEEMKSKKAEQRAIDETRSKMHQNFKLRLLQSCVDVNDWDTADEICNTIYGGKLDLTLSKDVLQSAFKAIKWLVEPLYKKIDPTQSFQNVWSTLRKNKQGCSYTNDSHPSNVKQATTPELLFEGLQRVLRVVNLHIAFDEIAFTKVLKVIIYAIQQNPELKSQAANLCGEIFLPALALTSENYHLEHLVWQVLKHADFRQRYAFYSKMLQKTYLSYPSLLAKLIMVHRDCKMWSSRLNSDQLRQMSKQVCKIASGNALVIFDIIVNNAKSYDNMIDTQIQAIANCQELSLDIMAFTITKHLADTTEETLDDEANVSQWLNYLTKFAASFFKKYQNVEIIGLFTYLLHRQREEDNFLLGYVLNQIIAKMFGWSDQVINQLPANQLNVIAAGFVLMLEGKSASQEVRKNNKSTEALIQLFWDSPTKGYDKFAMRLMVQLAQYTQFVQNQLQEGSENLTLVSRLYDRVQVYFLHFVDTLNFLATSDKKFTMLLTESPAKTLSYDYRLPPQYVFQILRCALPPIYKLKPEQFSQFQAEFQKVLDCSLKSRLKIAQNSSNAQDNDYWDESRFIQMRIDYVWNCVKPEIYFIFWYMSLQNLVVCEQSYKEEIKRIGDQVDELKNPKTQAVSSAQKSVSSSELQKKNGKEVERLTKIQKTLQKEQEGLVKNQNDTFEYLKTKLWAIFEAQPTVESNQESQGHLNDSTNAFLQYCLYPRMLHSAKDALYSFHFFKLLHKLRVPNFKILQFLIAILKCVMPAMHCCSEAEAENLGIFFLELFGLLNHWSKKAVWDKECAGYSGFGKKFGSNECISHEEFEKIISESINKRFAVKMLCLEPTPKMYMKTRCSLIILNRMSPVFPSSQKNAEAIANRLQALVDAQKIISKDLYTLASRCNEQLKAKMKTFPEYIKEQQQKELLEKQAEETKAKAAKKSSDRPSFKEPRSHDKEGSGRTSEKTKGETSAQPKETKRESHGELRDSRSQQTPGRRPTEGSRQDSDQKGYQDKAQDTVRQVSSNQKSVRKEDYQSQAEKSSNSRPVDTDKKSAQQTTKQSPKEPKPSSQQDQQDRQAEPFSTNGQSSKAKAKAEDKQQQQSQRNQQTVERLQPKASVREKSPNSVRKNDKPPVEEGKGEQRSQKSYQSEPKALTIQPRSVITQAKAEKGRQEKSYTPQSIDYSQVAEQIEPPAKRQRLDNPTQRQDEQRLTPHQRDIHDPKMSQVNRQKEPVGYDHRISGEPRSERMTPVDSKLKEANRNEREFAYEREMMRQDKFDREPPVWRSQQRGRSRSPYGYDEYEQEGYYQRSVEDERQFQYQQQYNRKPFQGRPPMGNKDWVPDRPRDHSPQVKQWDNGKGYPEGDGRQRMDAKPRQPSPPQRFRPQGNFNNERQMQNRNNYSSGGQRQQRGGR